MHRLRGFTNLSLVLGAFLASLAFTRFPQAFDEAVAAGQTIKKESAHGPVLREYTSKTGDTIERIAAQFKLDPESIRLANPKAPKGILNTGIRLVIPPEDGILRAVSKGETLVAIAKEVGVNAQALAKVNRLDPHAGLHVGDRLLIPKSLLAQRVASIKDLLAQRALRLPSRGVITSRFGPRRLGSHHGLDLGAAVGTPVQAALAGTVTFAGWYSSIYGNFVILDHGNGLVTRYAHNSKLLVKKGDRVTAGQVIAKSGNTGRTTGPHIHFEVLRNGRAENPLLYARH